MGVKTANKDKVCSFWHDSGINLSQPSPADGCQPVSACWLCFSSKDNRWQVKYSLNMTVGGEKVWRANFSILGEWSWLMSWLVHTTPHHNNNKTLANKTEKNMQLCLYITVTFAVRTCKLLLPPIRCGKRTYLHLDQLYSVCSEAHKDPCELAVR